MEMELYSIYDRKTQVFMPPIASINEASAKRNLMSQLRTPSLISDFAGDYDLMLVGTFQDHDAMIKPQRPAKLICSLTLLKEAPASPE